MLLVKTQVDKSSIHGLGLFAAELIATGTPIWRFTPGFDLDLDLGVLDVQPAAFRERLLHYGYIDPRLNRYILCCDDARFINHSDTPNMRSDLSLDRYGIDAAARDIETGEELTIDYASVEGRRPKADAAQGAAPLSYSLGGAALTGAPRTVEEERVGGSH